MTLVNVALREFELSLSPAAGLYPNITSVTYNSHSKSKDHF